MDIGTPLTPLYRPLMRACGWTRAQRLVLSGADGSVLDVGCGPATLSECVTGGYVGVDIRMAMLSRADGTSVVCADAAALPFPGGAFDTVVSTAFLGLLRLHAREKVLYEMARVCRGSLRILEPVAPRGLITRGLTLSRDPLSLDELRRAGWHIDVVEPGIYAGLYTLVRARPTRPQSR